MPPAARSLDPLECGMHPVPDSPVSGAVMPRVPTVNIGFLPAARLGDKILCIEGSQGTILRGEPTVRIEGQPAARMGDPIGHLQDPVTHLGIPSGTIELGCPTVNIGSLTQVGALQLAARDGSAFCETCAEAAADEGS
jgi:uncharacterized Zn-binding protein involved in type VI secretion